MGNPMFGADSRLDTDTLSSNAASASSFPFANLSDDRLFTVAKPTSGGSLTVWDITTDAGVGNTATIDYITIVSHNLFSQGVDTVRLDVSPDNALFTNIFFGLVPANDKIIHRTFVPFTDRFVRLRIEKAAGGLEDAIAIGQLQWGKRIDFTNGFIQTPYDPQKERIFGRFNRVQVGNIVGAISTFQEREADINIPLLLDSELRDKTSPGGFQDFWDNHASRLKPFVFARNPGAPGLFEQDAMFCVVNVSRGIARPTRTPVAGGLRDLRFSV